MSEEAFNAFFLGGVAMAAIVGVAVLNAQPAVAPIKGDCNGDGQVNFVDVSIVMANWTGTSGPLPPDPANNLQALHDATVAIFEYDPGENRQIQTYACFSLDGPGVARLLERFDKLKGAQLSGPFPPPEDAR